MNQVTSNLRRRKSHIWECEDNTHSAHPAASFNFLKIFKCFPQSSHKLDWICLYLKTLQKI